MALTEGENVSLTELDFDEAHASQIDRTPPQDVPAEQSVLGAMLLSKDAIADVSEILKGADFYQPKHELIFDAILELYSRGEPADAITVASSLTKRYPVTQWGGPIYLTDLLASVSIASNAEYYARIVAEKATLRRLLEASIRISQMAMQGQGDARDIVDTAQQAIYNVSTGKTTEDYRPLTELMQPVIDEIEVLSQRQGEMSGVPTGFAGLDELTHGLHPGQMVIIAARPAVGKSTLGLDICRSASIKHGLTSAIFSLEMSQSEIVTRLLSAEASINFSSLRKGDLRDDDWESIASVTSRVSEAPLFIDDSPNLTMMEIRAKARRLKQT
ncbi:MAG: replicative DNA helicase, partial [Propionibacteriaceae bacterium]